MVEELLKNEELTKEELEQKYGEIVEEEVTIAPIEHTKEEVENNKGENNEITNTNI